jgi:DNA-binding transcriptional ArsR family regulator
MHKKLGVPVSADEPISKFETSEDNMLKALAEDYRVNPGLFMNREDLKERLADSEDEKLDQHLRSLEAKGLVRLYRDGRGAIALAKATYEGLRKAGGLERYRWFPEWLSKEFIF